MCSPSVVQVNIRLVKTSYVDGNVAGSIVGAVDRAALVREIFHVLVVDVGGHY